MKRLFSIKCYLIKSRKTNSAAILVEAILVIADNVHYHHSKKVQAFLEENEGSIMVAFLPAYSPALNPNEQVWNHAKLQLVKRAIKSEGEMKKYLISIMKSIQKHKEFIKSFFGMPDARYINRAYSYKIRYLCNN